MRTVRQAVASACLFAACRAFCSHSRAARGATIARGWLDAFLPAEQPDFEKNRRSQWPEQYAATTDEWADPVASDDATTRRLRPLLKNTQLESRALRLAYDASVDGWSARQFHAAVDGLGASVVLASTGALELGGYNPKGWVH